MGVTYYGSLLSGMVSFSLTISKGAGAFSLVPNITYRATVSKTSPAFALLQKMWIYNFNFSSKDPLELVKFMKSDMKQLQQLYRDRKFSPTDVDVNGMTLFHRACHSAYTTLSTLKHPEIVGCFRDLFRQLQSYQVPCNDVNADGECGLDSLVWVAYVGGSLQVIELSMELILSGIQTSESWLHSLVELSNGHWANFHRNVGRSFQTFVDVYEFQESLQCGPLSRAILKRDKNHVQVLLSESTDYLDEITRLGQSPLHLSLILDHGGREHVNAVDNAGFLPVSYASYFRSLECVTLLLEADSALYSQSSVNSRNAGSVIRFHTMDILVDALDNSTQEIIQVIVEHTAGRRRRLHRLALQVDPTIREDIELPTRNDQLLESKASTISSILRERRVEIPAALAVYGLGNIYTLLFNSSTRDDKIKDIVGLAQIIWDTGFRGVDEYNDSKQTLLMIRWPREYSRNRTAQDFIVKRLNLLSWAVARGADLTKSYLRATREQDHEVWVPHTPAAHFIAVRLMELDDAPWLWTTQPSGSTHLDEVEAAAFSTRVIQETACDDCICGCSSRGCIALSQMLKGSLGFKLIDRTYVRYHPQVSHAKRRKFYNWVGIETHLDAGAWDRLFSTIIRFETFTAMRLTHTCCIWSGDYYSYFDIYDEEKGADIREEEVEDLEELERLIAEFESKYQELGVTIPEFLDGYWTQRMDEVMQQTGSVDLEALDQIRRAGVMLAD